jgi:hypothetical protein
MRASLSRGFLSADQRRLANLFCQFRRAEHGRRRVSQRLDKRPPSPGAFSAANRIDLTSRLSPQAR